MRALFVFGALVLAALAQDSQELLNQAILAHQSGRYTDAVRILERVLTSNPNEPIALTAHFLLASSLLGQYVPGVDSPENAAFAERAETEFQEVLRREPGDKRALTSMASLKYLEAQGVADSSEKARKLDDATSWYLRVVGADRNNREAYFTLGAIDWMKWYPAWMQARSGMGMRPEQAGPLPVRAVRQELAAQYSGVIEDSIANFQKVLDIDPQAADAMAYMNLLISERADLRETPEEYRQDVAAAEQWVQKAMEANRMGHATPPPAAAPQRIRVGANVQAANLMNHVDPVYPPLAKEARIQGAVRFTTIIGRDGSVQNLTLISGHPLLVQAAREAAQQWTYKPSLLNGQPTEVVTEIEVKFTLEP
jgi:TonB family protein